MPTAPQHVRAPGPSSELSRASSRTAQHEAAQEHPHDGPREQLRALYDSYYASHDYERRYPRPNAGTLDFLWRHGLAHARRVADVGCGNGRYAVPVLEAGAGELVACDPSQGALDAFAERLHGAPWAARVSLVPGGVEALPMATFDRFLMLFGVLSHIGPKKARIEALLELRRRASPDARLLLSVPSRWRRRPLELLASLARPVGEAFGDVLFSRVISGRPQVFAYHLYTLQSLRRELADAGWVLEHAEAESLAPEWLVTRHPGWERLDRRLQRWWPAALGYGIRAVARPNECFGQR